MATIDLGKIKQVFRGTYNNATAYVPDDLVVFTDTGITSTYICTTASTGNNPSSGGTAHANWAYIAKGVTDPIPSQSGNSGKFLKTNGSALSFATAGGVLQVKSTTKKNGYSATSPQGSHTDITGLSVDITPTSTNNKILIFANVSVSVASSYSSHHMRFAKTVSGSTDSTFAVGDADGNRGRGTMQALGSGSNTRDYPIVASMMHLDTPASTATHTYKIQHGDLDNSNTIYINMAAVDANNTSHTKYVSNITVMEIAQGVL